MTMYRTVALYDVVTPTRPKVKPAEYPDLPFVGLEHVEAHTTRLLGTVPANTMKSASVHFQPGDVLYSRLRPYLNKVVVADFEGLCSAEFIVLPPNDCISGPFLKWLLNSLDFVQFANSLNAGDRPRVDFGQIGPYEFLLPSLDEQKRIVAEIETQLARLDDAVAALQRARIRLKRYRASVLKAACEGRLVPTEAELARQEGRDYEPASVLLDRISAEREANGKSRQVKTRIRLNPTELAKLPDGWSWTTWEDIAGRVTVGHVGPMKNEYVPSGIPFLRSQNVRENRFDPAGLLFISPEFHEKLSKSRICPGDLAVVRSGSVGVTCVIPETLGEANCADLVLIQCPEGIVPHYGAYYMNSLAKRLVRQGQVGVALIHFNTKSVAALPVPLPPFAEQERIVAEVERRLSIIDQIEATVGGNLKRAEALRQSILRTAFSGDPG